MRSRARPYEGQPLGACIPLTACYQRVYWLPGGMAYAEDLKSSVRKDLRVRVPRELLRRALTR